MNKQIPTNNAEWTVGAQFHEYTSAVNPQMPVIDVQDFPSSLHEQGPTRVIPFDLSEQLMNSYPSTTPNLMANFLRICSGESLPTHAQATSQMFYVIRGQGSTVSEWGLTHWKAGDLFVVPHTAELVHTASEDAAIYWVSDAPILNYLGVVPTRQIFKPVLYTREMLTEQMERVSNEPGAEKRNRSGVLLANPACPITKTLTPTLWSLYNKLPAGRMQKPHRHNSIAIDYCVDAGPDTYTLIGKELDENGQIVDPIKAMWTPGSVFITPPGWWHSHHNDSGEDAIVLPIQDAGLVTYMQILDIQFSSK